MGRYSGLSNASKKAHEFIAECFNENVAKIVDQHAIASVFAGMSALLPGAGPTVCVISQTALVYTMYVRINNAMGIRLGKNKLKSLASAVVANIASNAACYLAGVVAATALSLIPGLGSAASNVLMVAIGYATVMIAAVSYAGIMNRIGVKDVENMSEAEMKAAVKKEMGGRNIGKEMKDLMGDYKQGRKNGTFTGKESVTLET